MSLNASVRAELHWNESDANYDYYYYLADPKYVLFKDPTSNGWLIFLTYVDVVMRVFAFLQHLLYFLIVFIVKDLQQKSLVFVHHVNFVDLLFCAHYLSYINALHPSFADPGVNKVLCTISEFVWAVLKYARMNSVLLVAIYRWIGVNRISLYKRLTHSKTWLMSTISIVWLAAVVLFLSTKYGFDTSYGQFYCFDGYSINYWKSIKYYIFVSVVGTAIPTVVVIVIYALISRKLSQVSKSLNNINKDPKSSSSAQPKQQQQQLQGKKIGLFGDNSGPMLNIRTIQNLKYITSKRYVINYMLKIDDKKKRNETRFAIQFFLINILVILSSVTILIISVSNITVLAKTFNKIYAFTQIVRIVNMFFMSLIPLFSLVFNQSFICWMKMKFAKKKTMPAAANPGVIKS